MPATVAQREGARFSAARDYLWAGLLVLTVYAWAHPYSGVVHDARLYMGQALQRSGLADLAADPFFAFGSQDRFTVFSGLLGAVVPLFGVSWTALIATALGAAAFLMAAHLCVRSMAGTRAAWCATLIVAALPGRYSALGIPLLEPYATPRSWACALVLATLIAALKRRHLVVVAALLGATLLHPLMALAGIAWIAVSFLAPRIVLTLGVAATVAMLGAAAVGVPVLDQLFVLIDDEWRSLLVDRSPYLYLLHWDDPAWSGNIGSAAMCAIAPFVIATQLEGMPRRVFLAGAGVSLTGVLISLAGGDWLQSALVIQLQPWRALWIGSFLTLAGTGMLLARVFEVRTAGAVVVLMGVSAGLLLQSSASPIPVILAGILVAALRRYLGERTSRWALAASVAVLIQAIVWCALERPNHALAREIGLEPASSYPLICRDPFVWMIGSLTAYYAVIVRQVRTLHVALALSLVAGLALALRDWRDATERDVARVHRYANVEELVAALPQDGSVYWDGDLMTPWFELGYPSYVSVAQTAGIVFNRATAVELARRTSLVAQAAKGWTFHDNKPMREKLPQLDLSGARLLCRDSALAAVFFESLGSEPQRAHPVLDHSGRRVGAMMLCEDLRRD
jgi:hypothetical protein